MGASHEALAMGILAAAWLSVQLRKHPVALALCLFVLVVTVRRAWVCDDASISLRYVDRLLAGDGLVFNRGERVQGFTHPLWLGLLTLGVAAGLAPHAWAIGLGLLLTGPLLSGMHRLAQRLELGLPGFCVVLAVTFGVEPFVQFQTSGL